MILCIAIPTISERAEQLTRLRKEVDRQRKWLRDTWDFKHVRVITDDTPRGVITVGEKRQKLYEKSDCEYTMMLDDDDYLAPNALEKIIQAIEKKPDVVTFQQLCLIPDVYSICEIKVGNQIEPHGFKKFKRPPFHACPMKTSLARKEPFEFTNFGEDLEWAQRMQKHLKTEIHIPGIIHVYDRLTKSYTQ